MSLSSIKESIIESVLGIGAINAAVDAKLAAERAAVEAQYQGQIRELETAVAELRAKITELADKVGAIVFQPAQGIVDVGQ